jgi:glutathionyl-hydroquinone reductase
MLRTSLVQNEGRLDVTDDSVIWHAKAGDRSVQVRPLMICSNLAYTYQSCRYILFRSVPVPVCQRTCICLLQLVLKDVAQASFYDFGRSCQLWLQTNEKAQTQTQTQVRRMRLDGIARMVSLLVSKRRR